MLVPQKTGNQIEACQHRTRNIRSLSFQMRDKAEQPGQRRNRYRTEKEAWQVHEEAPAVLSQVVSLCAKDEPFIAQKGHGDINHCGKCKGNASGKPGLGRQKAKKKANQQKKTAVAKESV